MLKFNKESSTNFVEAKNFLLANCSVFGTFQVVNAKWARYCIQNVRFIVTNLGPKLDASERETQTFENCGHFPIFSNLECFNTSCGASCHVLHGTCQTNCEKIYLNWSVATLEPLVWNLKIILMTYDQTTGQSLCFEFLKWHLSVAYKIWRFYQIHSQNGLQITISRVFDKKKIAPFFFKKKKMAIRMT